MRSLIVALVAILTAAGTCFSQPQIVTGTGTISLEVTEGVESAPVAVEWSLAGHTWRGTGANGLSLVVNLNTRGERGIQQITVTNAGQQRRLLEIALLATPELDPATAQYWDGGWSAVRPIPGPQETDEPRERGAWPLSAVGDASGATWMGITPDTLISFAEPTFTYVPDGRSEYRFHVRTVVDPGQEERFSLAVGTVADTQWGLLRSVWQAYHEAFPEYATVTAGAPDAIWGTSSQYHAWWPNIDREELRRLDCTWEWCYAPFKRSGDFWGREDEWVYESLGKPFSERKRAILGGSYDMGEISAEQFRQEREAFFDEYGYDTGALFYTPAGIWNEEQLALEKFADSMVVNEQTKTELSLWVTGYDDEVLVQPTGTSYGERLEEDYRLLAENLDIVGYAFDVCVAGQRNYSDAVQQPLAGRSWDERGVFFDLGISMVEQMQFIRGLDWADAPFDRGLIVGSGTSFTAWHVDGALLELTLTGQRRDSWEAMCMAMGGKPRVIWKGYELRDVLQDPDGMPRADFLNVWAKMADYVTLKSFQWGMLPGYNYLPGMDKLQRDFPLLRECIRAGWQPVCPVEYSGDDKLWMARYGSGADTRIAIGNPADEAVRADLAVLNEALGERECVFVNVKSPLEPLAQSIEGGVTRLSVECPQRRQTVLRSVLAIRCNEPLQCAASVQEDLDRLTARIAVTVANGAAAIIEVPERRGFDVAGVALNGADCAERITLRSGENVLEITYVSQHFGFDSAALDGFRFLTDEGEMAFTIVAPDPEERVQRRIIGHFDRYFRYYAQYELDREEIAEVVVAQQPVAGPQIVLSIGAGAQGNGWTLDGETLVLNAPDEQEAMRRTDELLAALDARFEHIVPFRPMYGMAGQHLTARDLHGLTMTVARAQEGQTW